MAESLQIVRIVCQFSSAESLPILFSRLYLQSLLSPKLLSAVGSLSRRAPPHLAGSGTRKQGKEDVARKGRREHVKGCFQYTWARFGEAAARQGTSLY